MGAIRNTLILKLRFSIRALLTLIVLVSLILVFHELVIEILVRGYWLIAAIIFAFGIWIARKSPSRALLVPSTILFPILLMFIYASSARKIIVDPENANLLFNLPALESILEQILAFWCRFHGDPLPGSIHFEIGMMETLLTVVAFGILGAATLGILIGLIVGPDRRITNG